MNLDASATNNRVCPAVVQSNKRSGRGACMVEEADYLY